jgi:hypothetical protein
LTEPQLSEEQNKWAPGLWNASWHQVSHCLFPVPHSSQNSPQQVQAQGHIQASLQQFLLLWPRSPCSWSLCQMIARWPYCLRNGRRQHCTVPHKDPLLRHSCQNRWSVQLQLSPHHLKEGWRATESIKGGTSSGSSHCSNPKTPNNLNLTNTNLEQEHDYFVPGTGKNKVLAAFYTVM